MSILNIGQIEWHKPEEHKDEDGTIYFDVPDPDLTDVVLVAMPSGEVFVEEYGEFEAYGDDDELHLGIGLDNYSWDEIEAWAYLPKHPTKKAEETK